jgi:hypothetical protein
MPPRARKNVPPPQSKETVVTEAPIIFFLKVSKEAQQRTEEPSVEPQPIDNATEYSEILKNEVTQQQFDETVIHEIIAKIHTQTEYPAGTACFWCCHTFSWKSCLIPTHYDVYTNQYTAEGHFCSPECALAWTYTDNTVTDSQRWLRHSLIQSMYSDLYKAGDLKPAPDKRVLRLFGGTLSIEQYRRYVKEGGAPLRIAMPPIRLYMPSINTQASTRDIKSYVTLSSDTVSKASQQLRLKRSKPVHSTTQTLDKCMSFNAVLQNNL